MGAITSFIPVFGLLLSVVGRIRARALGGAGKTSSTVGIVLSILFTAGFGFGVYEISRSSAADPGCVAYTEAGLSMNSTLEADSETLSSANASGTAAQKLAAEQKYLADMKAIESVAKNAEEVAQRQDVKSAIAKADGDLQLFYTQYSQYIAGGSSAPAMTTAENMITDGKAVMSLCGDATDG